MSLKRLLVGSISLSEDSQVDSENGGAGSEAQDEVDGCEAAGVFLGHYQDEAHTRLPVLVTAITDRVYARVCACTFFCLLFCCTLLLFL